MADDATTARELHASIAHIAEGLDTLLAERERHKKCCADLAALMRYVDDAKIEAQKLGRVSGEPLADFLRRLRAANGEAT